MGFMVTGVLFGLMRQAHAWELDLSFPSILEAVELNLRMPRSFLLLAVLPIFASLVMSLYTGHDLPVVSYVSISMVCYLIANGSLFILIFSSQLMFYMVAILHVFIKRSNAHRREFNDPNSLSSSFLSQPKSNDALDSLLPIDDSYTSSPNSVKGFGESQLEIFNYKHGLLILHLIATLMFIPSLVAWLQRIGMGSSFPWFIDSVVCIGIILHGLSGSRPDTYFLSIPLPFIRRTEISLSLVFLLSGYYSFLCALAASPYMALYAMAAIGAISLAFRIIDRYREVGSSHQRTNRKHSHRH